MSDSDEPLWPKRWGPLIAQMFEELGSGSPRAEAYWAQQLAFAPVFFQAMVLAVRHGTLSAGDLEHLRRLLPLALSMLGALPEGSGGDPSALFLLAQRQAQALASGRRRQLVRLAARAGLEIPEPPYGPVPSRFLRPYELIGWRPSQPSPGPAKRP